MRTCVYRLFMLAGLILALFGVSSGRAEAALPREDAVTHDLQERPLVFSEVMPDSRSVLSAYHYSHRSHASHYSHSSHRSHYSSRW